MADNSQRNLETISKYIHSEVESVLKKGGIFSALLGLCASAMTFFLIVTGAAVGLEIPTVFACVAGSYSIVIYFLARLRYLESRAMIFAVFLPFICLPTIFFITSHYMLPLGVAAYITGPFSYLYFHLIIMTGFLFDPPLSIVSGLLSGAGYLFSFYLARKGLLAISTPDPILMQDLSDFQIYFLKAFLMLFAGIMVALLSYNTKKLILRIFSEETDKARINKLFGQFVSEDVKNRIVDEKLSVVGEKKNVAVLFSDIRGFTAFSERTSPEEIVKRLNEYFDRMVYCIESNGGVVDKFIGDAIMAVFGGVRELEGPCVSAIGAARMMRAELSALNSRWAASGAESFENGIGLHYGEVLQGTIGSAGRKDFTVIGDTVNTASRMEGLTKDHGHRIIMTEEFYERLPENLRSGLVKVGGVKVKGKASEKIIFGTD